MRPIWNAINKVSFLKIADASAFVVSTICVLARMRRGGLLYAYWAFTFLVLSFGITTFSVCNKVTWEVGYWEVKLDLEVNKNKNGIRIYQRNE